MEKIILCDIDETCLMFADPFQEWLGTKGYNFDKRLRDFYNIEEWLKMPREKVNEIIYEFNASEVMINQPAEPDAAVILPKLYSEGYQFIAITSCGTSEGFREQRKNTLEKTFGFPWKDVHVVEIKYPKTDYLKQYENCIWVEDNHSHAIAGSELGHTTFLLEREYNKNLHRHDKVNHVKDWYEIYKKLKIMEEDTNYVW